MNQWHKCCRVQAQSTTVCPRGNVALSLTVPAIVTTKEFCFGLKQGQCCLVKTWFGKFWISALTSVFCVQNCNFSLSFFQSYQILEQSDNVPVHFKRGLFLICYSVVVSDLVNLHKLKQKIKACTAERHVLVGGNGKFVFTDEQHIWSSLWSKG